MPKNFICYCSGKKVKTYESDNPVYICENCGLVFDAETYNYEAIQQIVNTMLVFGSMIQPAEQEDLFSGLPKESEDTFGIEASIRREIERKKQNDDPIVVDPKKAFEDLFCTKK